MEYPGSQMEDKGTTNYLKDLGRRALGLGKDLAICPETYWLIMFAGIMAPDETNYKVITIVGGLATALVLDAAYVVKNNTW
jgi:hypothetical protein